MTLKNFSVGRREIVGLKFVRQAQSHGLTLNRGSEYERGPALLMMQRSEPGS
jgi:hypothetical protein